MSVQHLIRAGASRRYLRPFLFATAGTLTTYTLYQTFAPKPSHPRIPPTNSPLQPRLPPIPSRPEQISRLHAASPSSPTRQIYDLIIIGGGATGCGIALDAASRGLKVALIERDDFSSGTSSKSTKLVHGGVRYLEKAVKELDYNQYLLVKEALKERAVFLETAPHLSMSLPIMLPIYQWWKAPYYWAGTKAYDFLAGKENLESSYFLTRGKAIEAFPMLKEDGLVGALVYYDGSHNDSRMNVALAMTSALYGATVVNHMEVTQLLKDSSGKITGVKVRDCFPPTSTSTAASSVKKSFFSSSPSPQISPSNPAPTAEFEILAKGIINATGPFTDSIRSLDSPSTTPIVAPSSGVHIVLPGYYSPGCMGLIDPSTSDGRVIFFLPWQGNTIAGTTDAPTTITQHPIPREEEINWILSEVRRYLAPDINVRRGDVLAAWSGIRPLVRDPNARNTEALVRNHLINVSESGLLTIAGGKWTTYRQMAEEAVDEAITQFKLTPATPTATINDSTLLGPDIPGVISIDGTCKTEQLKLIGAHGYSKTLFINLIQHFGVETSVAQHLAGAYGDRAWTVASLSSPTNLRFPARGHLLNPLYPFVDGEVRYACRFEYAQTAVDVLARRTRLAFLNAQAALESLPKVIDIMGEELGWSGERKEREWRETVEFLKSMGLPRKLSGMSRREVEEGKAVRFDTEEEYKLYSRHGGLPSTPIPYENAWG